MDKILLNKLYKESLHSPSLYHHICYGGGTVSMVDTFTVGENYTCRFQGEKHWLTPQCEKCIGLVGTLTSLTCTEMQENSGMKILYEKILNNLES